MLSTANGELVIMTENTNSQLEFTHEPNNLISFIKYQCLVNEESPEILRDEQGFINACYNPYLQITNRYGNRRSGGSTLLAMVGFHYLLMGKKVLYYAPDQQMTQHFIRTTIGLEVDVIGWEIEIMDGGNSMRLRLKSDLGDGLTEKLNTCHGQHGGRGQRGVDVILGDCIKTGSTDMESIQSTLYPALNPQGKIILNISG